VTKCKTNIPGYDNDEQARPDQACDGWDVGRSKPQVNKDSAFHSMMHRLVIGASPTPRAQVFLLFFFVLRAICLLLLSWGSDASDAHVTVNAAAMQLNPQHVS
jgi:hypothetical protein